MTTHFVVELKGLAQHYNIGAPLTDLLCNHIVCRIKDEDMSLKTILGERLIFDKTLELGTCNKCRDLKEKHRKIAST